MCSVKVTKIAEAYEEELKRLGLTNGYTPEFFIKETLSQLEQTRRRLHQFIDEYVNGLKASFLERTSKETGDLSEIRKVIDYIQSEMTKMHHLNALLGSKF